MANIPIEQIRPNPDQPRKVFDPEKLQELAESIKTVGLLNPILVRPSGAGFEIVHGERRWRACQLAGLESIPAEVRDIDDSTAFLIAFNENLQRDDLNPVEEAQALQALKDKFNYSQAEIGAKIGKSQPWISGRLALLKLPDPIQEQVITRVINPSAARELSRIESPELQAQLAEKAASGNLTIRELEAVKDAPAGEWPPPVLCPDRSSFYDVAHWAKNRWLYVTSNPAKFPGALYHNNLTVIDVELMRAAGGLLSRIEAETSKDVRLTLSENLGKVVIAFAAILADMKIQTINGELQGIIEPRAALKYPWAEDLLENLGILVPPSQTPSYKLTADEFFNLTLDLYYLALWHSGNLYKDDALPNKAALGRD